MRGHRTASRLVNLFGHTARFIADKKNVIGVDTLQRIWLFGPAGFCGYEVAFGICDQFYAVGFDVE